MRGGPLVAGHGVGEAAVERLEIADRLVELGDRRVPEGQRGVVVGAGVGVGVHRPGVVAGAAEVLGGQVVAAGQALVVRHRRRDRGRRRRGPGRGQQRVGDPVVQEPAASQGGVVVHEPTDLSVGEVVGRLAGRGALLHQAPRQELVEAGDRFVVAAPAGGADDVEGERSADHRRGREQLGGAVGQRGQAAAQQVADVGRDGSPPARASR